LVARASLPSTKNHVQIHQEKARHDKELADTLYSQSKFPDWIVTCSFYSALHCIDAYAHKLGIMSFEPTIDDKLTAHQKRLRFIDHSLKAYFGFYQTLYSHCRQCRYDPEYYKLMLPIVPEKMVKLANRFFEIK
jgi:hypothetical protein